LHLLLVLSGSISGLMPVVMRMHDEAIASWRQAEMLNERLSGRVESPTRDNAHFSLQVSRFETGFKACAGCC
jgi:hypothetical protein